MPNMLGEAVTDGRSPQISGASLGHTAPEDGKKLDSLSLWQVLLRNGSSVCDLILIISLLSVETLFQDRLFDCPCDVDRSNVLYGGAFLFIPALILFVASLFSSVLVWRLVYGFCWRPQKRQQCAALCGPIIRQVMPRAFTMPFVWLVYAFINGEFYECMLSSQMNFCRDEVYAAIQRSKLRADSQIIGIFLLCGGILVYFAGKCVVRACTNRSFYMWQYGVVYEEQLAKELLPRFRECADKDVKSQINKFMCHKMNDANWFEFTGVARAATAQLVPVTPGKARKERDISQGLDESTSLMTSQDASRPNSADACVNGDIDLVDLNKHSQESNA